MHFHTSAVTTMQAYMRAQVYVHTCIHTSSDTNTNLICPRCSMATSVSVI